VVVGAMHSEWTAQTGCVLDLHALPEGDVVDVDPALFCQERLFAEDPECPPRRDISKAG
jgi:hypothetical protein